MAVDLKGKKWLWIGIAVAVVIVAVACVLVFVVFQDDIFGEDTTGPEQTVQDMFDAMSAKDVEGFFAVMDPEGLQQVEAMGLTIQDFKDLIAGQMSYDSMTFEGVQLDTVMGADGKTATVTVVAGKMITVENGETQVDDVQDSESPQTYQLILKDDGKWYLDMAGMM